MQPARPAADCPLPAWACIAALVQAVLFGVSLTLYLLS